MPSESGATYVAPGYLAYYRGGDLLAQPFDARHLRLYGAAAPIATHAVFDPLRFTAMYSFSANGVAVVATGAEGAPQSELTWFDLAGHKLGTVGTPAAYDGLPAVSPDGKTAAVGMQDADNGDGSLWLVNLSTGNRSPFAGPWHYSAPPEPAWSPDGRQIAYISGTTGWVKPADGSAAARKVVPSLLDIISWAHGGAGLLLDIEGADGFHEGLMPLRPGAKVEPLAGLPSQAMELGLSPDGHWLAYMARSANLSPAGVFVTPYPGPGAHWQLAPAPAQNAGWLPDGRHMLYVTPDGKLVEVDVSAQGSQFVVGPPRSIFGGLTLPPAAEAANGSITLALSPDGKRLLLPLPVPGTGANSGAAADGGLRLITDWTRLLPQR